MSKSILVTGATGFIGSRLVNSLIKKDYEVSALIRKGKKGNQRSDIIFGDLTDSTLNISNIEFQNVFHLASHTPLERNKKVLEKVNLEGTKKLFSSIKDKTKSFTYISGLGVYGETLDKIVDETFPHNPNTDFVKTRLEAQKFLEKNCKELGINFTVVYFGDVYGSGGWFYEMLVKRLLKNTFRMPKGGDYYKAFVHVEDAVGSMISIFEKNPTGGEYIIADNVSIKFNEFVDFTADNIGVNHPGSIPMFVAKAILGGDLIKLLTTSMKVSNKKISKIYEFKFPSYQQGIPNVISELKTNNLLN
ncbi:putative nucleoside-diphosphate sugar epimerase [metagenome]